MSTPAIELLRRSGVPHQVHVYPHDPAAPSYGAEAARALGVDGDRVLKTLVADLDGSLVLGLVPVTGSIDLKALAAALGGRRARMADPAAAQRATGYVLGGISPLGQRSRLPTAIEETAELWETVFVSAGRRGWEVELSADDLVRLTAATVAALAR